MGIVPTECQRGGIWAAVSGGQLRQNWPAASLVDGEVVRAASINVAGLTEEGLESPGIPARAVAWFRVNKIEWAK